MANVNISVFYKNYTKEELDMIKEIITDTLKDVDENNVLEKAGLLSNIKYNKYPEIQYYRVNLLLRAGKINKAYKVACNCPKFAPLVEIAKDLEKKIKELEPTRLELIGNCVEQFARLCPEVTIFNANETIKDLVYEDALELKNMLDEISKIDSYEVIIEKTKDAFANRYAFIQYLRIRSLLILNRKEKATKILTATPKNNLFKPLEKGLIIISNKAKVESTKQETTPVETVELPSQEVENKQEESIIEDNEINNNESLSISTLISKLSIDLLSIKEIEESTISDLQKDILTIAFYDKYNYKVADKLITKKIRTYKLQNEIETVKKLQKIQEKLHLSFRRKQFDITYYENCLGTKIQEKEIERLKQQNNTKDKQEESIKVIKSETKKEKGQPKYITSDSIGQSTISISPKVVVSNPKVALQKNIKKTTIKEVWYSDILEVELELYKQMSNPSRQKDAIKAWDILENMVNKSIDDEEAVEKVAKFLGRVDATNRKGGLTLSNKYVNYLKK